MDAAISGREVKWNSNDLREAATHCNDKKKNAKMASEKSEELYLALFVKECGPIEPVTGVVIEVDMETEKANSRNTLNPFYFR